MVAPGAGTSADHLARRLRVGLLPPGRAPFAERDLGGLDPGAADALLVGAARAAYVAAPRHQDPGELGAPCLGDRRVGGSPAAAVDHEVAPVGRRLGRLAHPVSVEAGWLRVGDLHRSGRRPPPIGQKPQVICAVPCGWGPNRALPRRWPGGWGGWGYAEAAPGLPASAYDRTIETLRGKSTGSSRKSSRAAVAAASAAWRRPRRRGRRGCARRPRRAGRTRGAAGRPGRPVAAEAPQPVAQVGDPAQRPLGAGALDDEVAGEAAVGAAAARPGCRGRQAVRRGRGPRPRRGSGTRVRAACARPGRARRPGPPPRRGRTRRGSAGSSPATMRPLSPLVAPYIAPSRPSLASLRLATAPSSTIPW